MDGRDGRDGYEHRHGEQAALGRGERVERWKVWAWRAGGEGLIGEGLGLDWGVVGSWKWGVRRDEGGYEVRGDKGMYGRVQYGQYWWWKVVWGALYVGEMQ